MPNLFSSSRALRTRSATIGILTFVGLLSCSITVAVAAQSAALVSPSVVAPDDAHFMYEGRFDTSDASGPVFVWQGSRVRFDFEGDSIALQFSNAEGQNFFDAEIDGHTSLVEVRANAPVVGGEFTQLGSGRHHLVLFKRSEAAAGTVRFRGVTLNSGGKIFPVAPPRYKLAMQFFGDSITAGACNEDGAVDQWEDRRTHNNAKSYGAFTAAALEADYRNIAVSGMGIAKGWVTMKAGEIWDRVYPIVSSPRADLSTWTPDVIFVNLGENDDSFTTSKAQPFPAAEFIQGYVSLIRAIRNAYPKAQIVTLRGGMFGGARSERLRGPWEAAITQLQASDPHVTHFVFKHWSSTHPRVNDHRAMADELVSWLKEQSFMTTYR